MIERITINRGKLAWSLILLRRSSKNMIPFRNSPGFTLIEAMLSIALIAVVMTPLMITQGSVVQAVSRISLQLQRIFFAENFFVDAQAQAADKKKFSLDKKIEDPSTTITFERKAIDAKSSLAKVENVVLDRITASWNEESKKRKEVLVLLHYNKPQSSS